MFVSIRIYNIYNLFDHFFFFNFSYFLEASYCKMILTTLSRNKNLINRGVIFGGLSTRLSIYVGTAALLETTLHFQLQFAFKIARIVYLVFVLLPLYIPLKWNCQWWLYIYVRSIRQVCAGQRGICGYRSGRGSVQLFNN